MSPIIDRTQIHGRVALPGDPDLDCDITGIVVAGVVSIDEGQELLVRLEGGHGRWFDVDTGELVDVDHVANADVRARLVDMPTHLWRLLVDQLEQWRDTGVPLWYGSVPGKVSALIEDPDHYVFLPRRDDPLSD